MMFLVHLIFPMFLFVLGAVFFATGRSYDPKTGSLLLIDPRRRLGEILLLCGLLGIVYVVVHL